MTQLSAGFRRGEDELSRAWDARCAAGRDLYHAKKAREECQDDQFKAYLSEDETRKQAIYDVAVTHHI